MIWLLFMFKTVSGIRTVFGNSRAGPPSPRCTAIFIPLLIPKSALHSFNKPLSAFGVLSVLFLTLFFSWRYARREQAADTAIPAIQTAAKIFAQFHLNAAE